MTGDRLPAALVEVADTALEVSVVGSFSRLGFAARQRLYGWADVPRHALRGRIALVTGATSGLGLAAAKGLAHAGAEVIVLGRNPERAAEARSAVAGAGGDADVHVAIADLSRLADVRRVADELRAGHDRLDIVVHNAGALVHELERTTDGIEVTAQTHVVAPFLLTAQLYPLLESTPDARVITVTSGGMYTTALDVDALDHPPSSDDFDGVKAYARAKRAQVVLTQQWATRSAPTGISFHAMHPGWADTPGLRASLPRFQRVLGPLLRTPDQAVDTTVWLATSDEPPRHSGRLWLDRHRRRTVYLPGTATPPGEARRLWSWCVERADVDDPTAPVPGARASRSDAPRR